MKFLNNIFDAIHMLLDKMPLESQHPSISTIEWSLLKCIYQRNNRIMFLSIEQIDDTPLNSPLLDFLDLFILSITLKNLS